MIAINLISVCTGSYSMAYAARLHRRVQGTSKLNFRHYCITDRANHLPDFVQAISPIIRAEGWWNKMNLYSKQMPLGWLLYMDLDIVVQRNFDDEVLFTIERGAPLNVVSDAIGWRGQKFSSSFMLLQSGFRDDIFEKFKADYLEAMKEPGGDQIWTGPLINPEELWYIDEAFPNLKKNLKFHLATRTAGGYNFPTDIPEEVKMVDCSGRPKPHELAHLDYIRKNWHEVQLD